MSEQTQELNFEQLMEAAMRKAELNQLNDQAAAFISAHLQQCLPMPVSGQRVRCTFSLERNIGNMPSMQFIPTAGSVYTVVASSYEPATAERMFDVMRADGASEEAIALVSDTSNPRPCVMLIENANGQTTAISYPASPGTTWAIVGDDALSEPNRTDLKEGQKVVFDELSAVGVQSFTVGTEYAIEETANCCNCDNADCPGNKKLAYRLRDNDGDLVAIFVPHSPFGSCHVITA